MGAAAVTGRFAYGPYRLVPKPGHAAEREPWAPKRLSDLEAELAEQDEQAQELNRILGELHEEGSA